MAFEDMLAKKDLVHGEYYRGICRHAFIARWDGESQHFVHWRTQFGLGFVEVIKHPDDEKKWDVFTPLSHINKPEKEIPFYEEWLKER